MRKKETGDFGEKIACEYLVDKGYKILAKNYRISFGEIDIVAQKKQSFFRKKDTAVHFIEVKSLSQMNVAFSPEQRAGWKKQQKIKKLAEIWLERNKFAQDQPYQIDIIGIEINEPARTARLYYYPDVVSE